MNQKMSSKMKKLTRLYGWIIPVILLYCIAFSFFFSGISMKFFDKSESVGEAIKFNVYDGPDVYASLSAQMMSREFASDFKETNHYYFVYDQDLLPYIVQVHGNLSQEYLNVQSYLYDESDEVPDPIIFYGISSPIEDDIRKYAIESYNEMWGEELVSEDNFSDYFGEYYLDTTRMPESPMTVMISFIFVIFFAFAAGATCYLVFRLNSQKFKKSRTTLKAWPAEKLLALDRQLEQAVTAAYEKEQLYLTNYYIITNAEGFEIIPYGDIERIYDTVSGAKKRLMAETKDQENHTLALVKGVGKKKQETFQEFASQVKRIISIKIEELPKNLPIPENQMCLDLAGLEASVSLDKKKGNLFFGIIGAIAGSLVGVGLWVLIGQIGFIAGIAGFVMLKLALSGYQKLGGPLDKKGAVTCLFITAAMILGANLLDYAVTMARVYFEYEASFETLAYVFLNFGKLMSDADTWSGFFLDLAIGYGLSVWSSASIIKAILKMSE